MADGPVDRFLIWMLMYGGGLLIAWAALLFIVGALRAIRLRINRARGAERPIWAPGIWYCATCLSTNGPLAERCHSCRRPREALVQRLPDLAEDVIPTSIPVPEGAIVAMVHDDRAHTDPGDAHWRLTVSGSTIGSAARRDGALDLLRRVDGTDLVMLDVRGSGATTFRLADAIARFESPRFPFQVSCPEASSTSVER